MCKLLARLVECWTSFSGELDPVVGLLSYYDSAEKMPVSRSLDCNLPHEATPISVPNLQSATLVTCSLHK